MIFIYLFIIFIGFCWISAEYNREEERKREKAKKDKK